MTPPAKVPPEKPPVDEDDDEAAAVRYHVTRKEYLQLGCKSRR